MLQAFARLGRPYHLLLIGGEREARPTPNITLLPYRRDSVELAQWLASADALVHAGTRETFGLVMLEAMACGRPVVGARAGAIPEIVDEEVGMLAKPGSAESLAEAIAALYERDLDAVGAAARARVLQRFTWAQAFQTQFNAYLSLVGRSRSPRARAARRSRRPADQPLALSNSRAPSGSPASASTKPPEKLSSCQGTRGPAAPRETPVEIAVQMRHALHDPSRGRARDPIAARAHRFSMRASPSASGNLRARARRRRAPALAGVLRVPSG